jgi:hypothetical protein
MVNQHGFSFGVLPTKVFSDPDNLPITESRIHLEDIFCNDVESVFFLLKKDSKDRK